MISLEKICKSYKLGNSNIEVLKGINLVVEEGEMISIMGSSGSGKSTLLNITGILDHYDSGNYFLDGVRIDQNLSETDAARIRLQRIGFVFQSFNLLPFKNAMENVALPLYYKGVSRKIRNNVALEFLERVGLKEHAFHSPNEMSGGQKQRIAIARALISNPKVILADEPTGALDSKTSSEIMTLLKEINSQGKTIVIVTHDEQVAFQTQRIIQLKDGRVVSKEVSPVELNLLQH